MNITIQYEQTCDGNLKLLNDAIRSSNSLVTFDFFDENVADDDDLHTRISVMYYYILIQILFSFVYKE